LNHRNLSDVPFNEVKENMVHNFRKRITKFVKRVSNFLSV
jgi:hypothetical protein